MANSDSLRGWKIAGLIALTLIVLSIPLHAIKESRFRAARIPGAASAATFVGRDACIECHDEAYEAWLGSDHDRSMAVASDSSVLGDFDDAVFENGEISARFYERDGKFYVYTLAPDGEPTEFEIAYTLGFEPLQQYLIPFPGGRLQAFSIAWDSERREWFYLYTGREIAPGDWLHWTRGGQNWNAMCAECHSTDLRKGYDVETKAYSTTWSEIDVSCEACHGPGSRHVAWAEVPPMARVASENYELLIKTSGISARQEVELCAPCHSRRTELGDYDHTQTDLLQELLPSLLTDDLYFADGQILGEVYDYGSFQQSKMYRAGVRCSDCHDVHSLGLVEQGNALCLRCHHANTYDSSEHHFHKKEHEGKPSDGHLCVSCHMPERLYMVIDYRADHSIRSPRPDLSLAIGVPNACGMSGCHDDETVEWSAGHLRQWYGRAKKDHYGTALAAGRARRPEAQAELIGIAGDTLYPAIVRATALSLLGSYGGDGNAEAFRRGLTDRDPLVRYTAVEALNPSDGAPAELLSPLLSDPIKAVRLRAATKLASTPMGTLQDYQRQALDEALLEFREAMEYSLDLPFAGFNLGNLYLTLRDTARAEAYYRAAIEIDPAFLPAKLNLAALLVFRGQREEAETLLRQVLAASPETYDAAYALALLLEETGRYEEAATYLRRMTQHLPGNSRAYYNLGLLEQALGRTATAEAALLRALEVEPDNLDYLYALADHYVRQGQLIRALEIADRMIASHPENETGLQVRIQLEAALQQALSPD